MESLKQQMNCDEEVLESWIKESNRKDNDIITIQKYAQQDEGKLGVSRNDCDFQKQNQENIFLFLAAKDFVMLSDQVRVRFCTV